MKIAFASDLHLEFGSCDLVGDADVLVLAGDTFVVDDIKKFPFLSSADHLESTKFGNSLGYYTFLQGVSSRFEKTVILLGNHEHYQGKFNDTYKVLKHNVESCFENIKVLENDSVELDNNTVLLAATLWTDLGNLCHENMYIAEGVMNDYKKIIYKQGNIYRKLRAKDTVETHISSVNFFRQELKKFDSKQVIMATHHAPCLVSAYPKRLRGYSEEVLTCYASDLVEFIKEHPQITHWIHGHVHQSLDYMIDNCNILCNPRGYYGYEHFDIEHTLKVIEI